MGGGITKRGFAVPAVTVGVSVTLFASRDDGEGGRTEIPRVAEETGDGTRVESPALYMSRASTNEIFPVLPLLPPPPVGRYPSSPFAGVEACATAGSMAGMGRVESDREEKDDARLFFSVVDVGGSEFSPSCLSEVERSGAEESISWYRPPTPPPPPPSFFLKGVSRVVSWVCTACDPKGEDCREDSSDGEVLSEVKELTAWSVL